MTQSRWHMLREGEDMTLCRQQPPRFDVAAQTTLPPGQGGRYAHQIRQDMWRVLQNVRGFSPVVRLEQTQSGWNVTAGGRVMAPKTASLVSQIANLLEDPTRRRRWIAHANRKSGVRL